MRYYLARIDFFCEYFFDMYCTDFEAEGDAGRQVVRSINLAGSDSTEK